jgi:hypothetical protein
LIDYSSLVGVPWVKKGRSVSGMDCLGLVIAVRQLVGKKTPDYIYDDIVPEEIDRDFREFGFVSLERPRPFCLVTFIDEPPYSSHLGVVLEDCSTFLHSRSRGQGKSVVERLEHPLWKRRRTGFWEVR